MNKLLFLADGIKNAEFNGIHPLMPITSESIRIGENVFFHDIKYTNLDSLHPTAANLQFLRKSRRSTAAIGHFYACLVSGIKQAHILRIGEGDSYLLSIWMSLSAEVTFIDTKGTFSAEKFYSDAEPEISNGSITVKRGELRKNLSWVDGKIDIVDFGFSGAKDTNYSLMEMASFFLECGGYLIVHNTFRENVFDACLQLVRSNPRAFRIVRHYPVVSEAHPTYWSGFVVIQKIV
ncbi:hypothetical protein ACW7BJ_25335 [Azospirillum argentinense]